MPQTSQNIYYTTYGKNLGYTLVLLHGYLESSESWNNFAELFADEYFVVCIDLPGHGKSSNIPENPTMDKMADAIISVTDHLGIKAFHLVGHSMGGYAALAVLAMYPERLNSIVLLHSHCYADPEEKRTNREREIELVIKGKKELIVNSSIPRLFSNDNVENLNQQVENSINIALQTPDSGIISALTAMKSRPDCSEILAKTNIPVLLVGGRKDNLIPFELMEKMKTMSPVINLVCLENSGHMGFVEERELAAKELKQFFDRNFECF